MTDRMVIRLSENWAVLADDLQWILAKAQKQGPGRRKPDPPVRWRGLSYIASTKVILLRCVREKGAVVDPDGSRALDALPDTFREWRQRQSMPDQGAA